MKATLWIHHCKILHVLGAHVYVFTDWFMANLQKIKMPNVTAFILSCTVKPSLNARPPDEGGKKVLSLPPPPPPLPKRLLADYVEAVRSILF